MSAVILFDGYCLLCKRSVQFVLRHDLQAHFKFASLQSAAAKQLLYKHGGEAGLKITLNLDTVALIELDPVSGHGEIFTQSRAVIRILQILGKQNKHLTFVALALRLLPTGILNGFYQYLGSHRYQWFGESQECWRLEDFSERFLD